jgi:hypothetical protein
LRRRRMLLDMRVRFRLEPELAQIGGVVTWMKGTRRS